MEIKKLKTDYAYTDRMNREDSPPCKHFSLRGYVAQMRQKDLRICSPFAIDGSETQPSLPPLAVPRFQSWSCNVCRGESVSDIINQRACSEGIDINNFIDLTGDSDDSESDDETAEVETTRITVPPGHLNHQLSNPVSFFHPKRTARSFRYPKVRPCPRIKDAESFFFPKTNAGSSEVRPSVTQDMHRNESGFEGNVACESEVELVISNPKGKGKSFSEVANKGKQIYEDNQSLQELRKSCTLQGNVIVIADEEDVEPEAEQFPQVPVTEDNVHAEHSDKNGESGVVVLDHHQQKNTGNSSKKFKRMRLLREILGEDDEPKTEQIRIERTAPQNPSVHSEPEKTIMNEEVGEGDAKKLEKKGQRGRKRKLILDEDDIPLSMIFPRAENDAPNMPTSPLAQVAPNEEGLGEGLHQSSNNSPQTENEHTLPMPIQKGQGGETDSDGERRSAISRQGKGVRIEEIDEATRKQNELVALEALLQICQNHVANVEPEPQIKQLKGMDFDLNVPYNDHRTDRVMIKGKTGRGVSIDLNADATAGSSDPTSKMLNPGGCSKTKMDIIGSSSKTNGSLKGKLSEKSHALAIYGRNTNGPSAGGWLDPEEEEETPTQGCDGTRASPVSLNNNISERFCGTNRNPADFTPIEPGNPYMRKKKDEVRKRVTEEKRCGSSSKQNKKPKKP